MNAAEALIKAAVAMADVRLSAQSDHVWMDAGAFYRVVGEPLPASIDPRARVHFDRTANNVHLTEDCVPACPR